MALIAVQPFALTNATVKVGTSNFETSVSQVEFVPTVPTFGFKGLTPNSAVNFPGSASWVVNLTAAQDWDTTGSLANYLLASAGTTVVMDFVPKVGGKTFRASVTLQPGTIGGSVDTVPTFSVTLQVVGAPSIVTP
jgi:hypothetical protein